MTDDLRAMLLLSGGIDSPVAGHLVQAQGVDLAAVHFSMEPFTDAAAEEKAARLAGALGLKDLLVVPAGPAFGTIAQELNHGLYFVLTKRFMVRAAARLAQAEGRRFLVTGENLGQVSSQTLHNLTAIDQAAPLPVLRPLVGFDKVDIVDVARDIGTFHISVGPEVCDVLGPDRPATRATVGAVEREEDRVDMEALLAEAVGAARRAPALPPEEAKAAGAAE